MKLLKFFLKETKQFPNNKLPVLVYKKALELPAVFPGLFVRKLFQRHHWTNNWKSGIYSYHHYHSNTHEVMGVVKGKARLLLGGEKGLKITISKGDVIIIPAGVAHKNLGKEKDIMCVGGYPGGKEWDIKYGRAGERPAADKRISRIPLPAYDPVTGKKIPLHDIWKKK